MPVEQQDTLIYIIALITGLCFGSFLNVVIYRLPLQLETNWRRDSQDFLGIEQPDQKDGHLSDLNIAKPASHCPHCGGTLKPWHNIPLISYIFLRGRCNHCATRISFQYPAVELISGLIFLLTVMHFGLTVEACLVAYFSLCLLTLTAIDFRTQLLPDILTYPLLWAGLLANTQALFTSLESAVIGAAAGYFSLWSVYWLFKMFTGKEGMGHGDFKLLAALGAWTGWQMLPLIILMSSLVGAIIGLSMVLILGRDKQIPMAFGPYLAIAGWISFFWGESVIEAYLSLLA